MSSYSATEITGWEVKDNTALSRMRVASSCHFSQTSAGAGSESGELENEDKSEVDRSEFSSVEEVTSLILCHCPDAPVYTEILLTLFLPSQRIRTLRYS